MGDLASLPDWERLLECPNAVRARPLSGVPQTGAMIGGLELPEDAGVSRCRSTRRGHKGLAVLPALHPALEPRGQASQLRAAHQFDIQRPGQALFTVT